MADDDGLEPRAEEPPRASASDQTWRAGEQLQSLGRELTEVAQRVEEGSAARQELDDINGRLRATIVRQFGPRKAAGRGSGGKVKILEYLSARSGEWVYGEELAAISGIQEWARRVRELRIQDGYDIEEDSGAYRLSSVDPDPAVAGRWKVANEIRRKDGSAASRLLAFLVANENRVVDREELDYVAKIAESARRVRELRDEKGWPIESHIDDPALQPGQYRLVSASEDDRRDVRQRLYPEGLREKIFARDDYTCQKCGRNRDLAEKAGDTRFYLEVHHLRAVAEQLDSLSLRELNDEENLITYCHRDHIEETARLQERRRAERGGLGD
jgi:5-methylcytosine-specific restriction endonuclease McrA/biotin operon repressor